MTRITLEFEQQPGDTGLSRDNIKEGFYLGTILAAQEAIKKLKDVDSRKYIITWDIHGVILNKHFNFWDAKAATREKAYQTFKRCAEIVGVKVEYDEKNRTIDFNDQEFQGKQADLLIKRFVPEGEFKDIPYIDSHYKAGSKTIHNTQTSAELRATPRAPIPIVSSPPSYPAMEIDDDVPF